MPDVSPTRWHLAHTSWFFETFILKPADSQYRSPDAMYDFLFNSYYNLIGDRWARPARGLLTRPTVKEIFEYRHHVTQSLERFIETCELETLQPYCATIELGINHEQQHQELMITDLKHVFALNPLHPVYQDAEIVKRVEHIDPIVWKEFDEGLYEIGHRGDGFAFDNESPRHRVYVDAFSLANRLTTAGEYLEFMNAGGYAKPELWLSDGWALVQAEALRAPLYWHLENDGLWWQMTLSGYRPVEPSEPVTHISFYEAEAFAAWSGARLPSEEEWEIAASGAPIEGSFVEAANFHPAPLQSDRGMQQLYGEVWQWCGSSYLPYPGFKAAEGAIGEYNGKFMSNQMVLRGASCATPHSHARLTYRNFFPPSARWQFSGIRLARS